LPRTPPLGEPMTPNWTEVVAEEERELRSRRRAVLRRLDAMLRHFASWARSALRGIARQRAALELTATLSAMGTLEGAVQALGLSMKELRHAEGLCADAAATLRQYSDEHARDVSGEAFDHLSKDICAKVTAFIKHVEGNYEHHSTFLDILQQCTQSDSAEMVLSNLPVLPKLLQDEAAAKAGGTKATPVAVGCLLECLREATEVAAAAKVLREGVGEFVAQVEGYAAELGEAVAVGERLLVSEGRRLLASLNWAPQPPPAAVAAAGHWTAEEEEGHRGLVAFLEGRVPRVATAGELLAAALPRELLAAVRALPCMASEAEDWPAQKDFHTVEEVTATPKHNVAEYFASQEVAIICEANDGPPPEILTGLDTLEREHPRMADVLRQHILSLHNHKKVTGHQQQQQPPPPPELPTPQDGEAALSKVEGLPMWDDESTPTIFESEDTNDIILEI